MQLIYYKTVLGHEFCPYFGNYPILVFKFIEHSESLETNSERCLALAMGTACKTIKHYWPSFVTTFDAILLWGWISLVNNMGIDVTVRLLYLWFCLIKSPVKNRTSGLYWIKAEWVRMWMGNLCKTDLSCRDLRFSFSSVWRFKIMLSLY